MKSCIDIFCNIAKFQQNRVSEIFKFVNNIDINNFTSCHKNIKFLYLLITIKLSFFYFTIILLLLFKTYYFTRLYSSAKNIGEIYSFQSIRMYLFVAIDVLFL